MNEQQERAQAFRALHKKDQPVIIYNVWDGGSARAVLSAGAKAIATGDHPVGFAHGYLDNNFDEFNFDTYLGTIKEIANVIDGQVPFSVDISNGQGLSVDELKDRIGTLIDIGIVGINFEDRADDVSLRTPEEQAVLIQAIRQAADEKGIELFINARTDLFAQTNPSKHHDVIDDAIKRVEAYTAAGASGFFTPGLVDIELIKKLSGEILLPLNIIRLPNAPSAQDLKSAGVSRISYGPVPQMQMSEWLKQKAIAAFSYED